MASTSGRRAVSQLSCTTPTCRTAVSETATTSRQPSVSQQHGSMCGRTSPAWISRQSLADPLSRLPTWLCPALRRSRLRSSTSSSGQSRCACVATCIIFCGFHVSWHLVCKSGFLVRARLSAATPVSPCNTAKVPFKVRTPSNAPAGHERVRQKPRLQVGQLAVLSA